MPTIDINQETNQLILKVKQAQVDLEKTKQEHRAIRSPIILGPMDDTTPWTSTALRMNTLNQRIQQLTTEIGQRIIAGQ